MKSKKKSIFRSLFVPLIFLMILQAALFYLAAVYGGLESNLNQNASDILEERLTNRKNEVETTFNRQWSNLDGCAEQLNRLYADYETKYGEKPFVHNTSNQLAFLGDAQDHLIQTIRNNKTNGVFLILNDQTSKSDSLKAGEKKNGIGIRDLDSTSNYTDKEDLLIERSPGSLVQKIGCSLDSWWEAYYLFSSREAGAFYYNPLSAAWGNPDAQPSDIAYLSGRHHLKENDNEVLSYSIPLMDENGYPYGVLGIELTTKYLASLLPNEELSDANSCCYILGLEDKDSKKLVPITESGVIYQSCFSGRESIDLNTLRKDGSIVLMGNNQKKYFGKKGTLNIYNNNNPFEKHQLTLVALVNQDKLFEYSRKIKGTLLIIAALSLAIGIAGIFFVSHRFASPITALAKRARDASPQEGFHLEHLGIEEIDQLVDSIESLSENVNKEVARTEFFSRMSHDMRTPMNAIISFSSKEMLEGAGEQQKDDYLKNINSSGNYLLGLINEVLDMTKIESNMVDLQYQDIAAQDICNTVIPMIDKLAEKKNIRFEKQIQIPEDLLVQADIQHMEQIIMNLLSNAVKFTSENGEVIFDLCMRKQKEGMVDCQILVKDNGIGMSPEFMSKLYTPFEQEHPGNGGTGLGLSICKKLTGLMGGSIQCDSVQGKGTTFVVEIPLSPAQGVSAEVSSERPRSGQGKKPAYETLVGKKVLLCEDHPLNRQIAETLLTKRGMIVETAEDGQQGVEKFKNAPAGTYDAILMDIRMPIMDGLTATSTIRALNRPDAKVIPIIAMTANAFVEDVNKSQQAGMNAHLSKPIEPDKLFGTLSELIGRRS